MSAQMHGSTLRGGVDLGGTKIEAIVVDGTGEVRGSARHPTPSSGGPNDVADEIAAVLSEAAEAAGTTISGLAGVGVGSPGAVDASEGTVSSARNLPGWDGSYALGPELARRFGGAKVRVGNDVAVATMAEFELGGGRGHDSVLGLFWGTGIGGGLVLGGAQWHGRGGAGEIGHMVIKNGGRRCGCGNRGCLEAYAGRASLETYARREIDKGRKSDLLKIMKDRGGDHFTSSVWWHAVDKGDKLAIELIDGAVDAIGAGVASACNLLDVELVLIGGGLGVRFGEPYVKRIRKAIDEHRFPGHSMPEVELVELGDLGGAIGASLLV